MRKSERQESGRASLGSILVALLTSAGRVAVINGALDEAAKVRTQ